MAQPYLHGHLTCVAAPATWLSRPSGQLTDGVDGLYVNDRRILTPTDGHRRRRGARAALRAQ